MRNAAVGDRFPDAVLSDLSRSGPPDLTSCNTLVAQCLDALPAPIKVMNVSGRVVFYNRAAYRFFGPRIAWARLAHERDELFHHDDLDTRKRAREKVLRDGIAMRVDLRAIRFDYVPCWHEFDLTPLFDKSQLVTGMLIRMTEISGRAA